MGRVIQYAGWHEHASWWFDPATLNRRSNTTTPRLNQMQVNNLLTTKGTDLDRQAYNHPTLD